MSPIRFTITHPGFPGVVWTFTEELSGHGPARRWFAKVHGVPVAETVVTQVIT